MKAPVSVIVPTYNEERHIRDCLESVTWADEIILVDGGSTDRTRQIAASYTSHVLVTSNAPAETQRLKALDQIRNEWFFLLDADEQVSPELAENIQTAIREKDGPSAYYVLRKNLYRNYPVRLHEPDYQLRLFKLSEIPSLPERIHRIPKTSGKTGRLKGKLTHYFFSSVQDYMAKWARYTSIEATYWRESGRKVNGMRAPYYFVLRPSFRFFQYYFLKRGFLDGFFGLFFSFSSAFYEVLVAALVREPGTNPEPALKR